MRVHKDGVTFQIRAHFYYHMEAIKKFYRVYIASSKHPGEAALEFHPALLVFRSRGGGTPRIFG